LPPMVESHPPENSALSYEKDLLERPVFSFRLQIILGFFTFFILSVAITIAAMIIINDIEKRIATVQVLERFLFNIEQARRWEKNFFLYGTNLNEALQSAQEARDLVEKNLGDLDRMTSRMVKEEIIEELDLYYFLLYDLTELVKTGHNVPSVQDVIENGLRHYGFRIVKKAAELASTEFDVVTRWLHLLQKVPAYFLAFLFLLMVYMAWFLSRRFMKPLKYLVDQTRRIAKGDFTPLRPVRKYRDEFTTVEVAVNRMLKELEHRQKSLIESHKLRAVGILTAGVAHELNNPLNNIMLTAYSILEEYGTLNETEHLEMVKDIIAETERSRSIVHNLLDFTRENISVLELLDPGKLVQETAKLALNQARVRRVAVHVEVEPNLPRIQGDRQQLKQVVLNLVLNSLDAVAEGGRIGVRVMKGKPGFLAVQVEDNGCGIPADMLPHVFDPFFTTKPVGTGTGLGLSVSHGIVTKHGGRIEVESIPGQKTVFTITLPIDASPDVHKDVL
jgi:two-component system, NtrC family, sensor kinase